MAGKIFDTGDTHGALQGSEMSVDGFVNRLKRQNFPEQRELDRDDFVIINGDFGAVWDYSPEYVPEEVRYIHESGQTSRKLLPYGESQEEKYWLDWLSKQPFTLLAIGGNHENYDRILHAYPHVSFRGGKAAKLRENVYILDNGYLFQLGTKEEPYTVFTFGGARSHDITDGILDPEQIARAADTKKARKELYKSERKRRIRFGRFFRIRHVSWWPEENPSADERAHGIEALKKCGWKVDLILTHEIPKTIFEKLDMPKRKISGQNDQNGSFLYPLDDFNGDDLREYLDYIMRHTEYDCWAAGHYHINREFSIKSREMILYEQIIRLR